MDVNTVINNIIEEGAQDDDMWRSLQFPNESKDCSKKRRGKVHPKEKEEKFICWIKSDEEKERILKDKV